MALILVSFARLRLAARAIFYRERERSLRVEPVLHASRDVWALMVGAEEVG